MEENESGWLFWSVVMFAWLFAFLPTFMNRFVQPLFQETSEEHGALSQLADLQAQMKAVNKVDEFAKYAKLQRKVNKLKQDMKSQSSTRLTKMVKVKVAANLVFHTLSGLVFLFILWNYRASPVVKVDAAWFFPMNGVLSYPGVYETGGISTMVWLAVCTSVAKMAANKLT